MKVRTLSGSSWAGYLGLQARGGVRRPKGQALVVPVKMRRNKYGNMAKGAVKRAAAKPGVFVASRKSTRSQHLPPGIYERPRGKRASKPKMLVAFESSAAYRKRWDFLGRAQRKATAVAQSHFSRRLADAIRTAK